MYHYWIKVFSLAEQAPSLPSANRNCQSKDLFLINARRYFILISTFFEKHWCSLKVKAGCLCLCLRLPLPAPPSSLVVRQSIQYFPPSFTFSPLFLAWKLMRWAGNVHTSS